MTGKSYRRNASFNEMGLSSMVRLIASVIGVGVETAECSLATYRAASFAIERGSAMPASPALQTSAGHGGASEFIAGRQFHNDGAKLRLVLRV